MAARGSGGFPVPRVLEPLYGLVGLAFQLGGAALLVALGYLAWGLFSGGLANSITLPQAERFQVAKNVIYASKILVAGGIACIISAAFRFYYEETLGYILMIGGALLYWGTPIAVGPTVQRMGSEAAALAIYAVGQVKLVGIVALAAAAPFILMDFWSKLRGVRRAPGGAAVVQKEELPKSRIYLFCWQMPYCRDYLRKFCKAYEQRKTCWRIKSGCYCDEDMILRVMKRSSTSRLPGFDQRYTEVAGGRTKDMTSAQKRDRCRQCFLYAEHQNQKYRLLSPLMFPLAVGLIWTHLKPVMAALSKALELTDKFAGAVSFGPAPGQVAQNPWANTVSTSHTVEWLFIVCLGFILVTYLLQALEYAVFRLQI